MVMSTSYDVGWCIEHIRCFPLLNSTLSDEYLDSNWHIIRLLIYIHTDLDFRFNDIDDFYIELFVNDYINIGVCVCVLKLCIIEKLLLIL